MKTNIETNVGPDNGDNYDDNLQEMKVKILEATSPQEAISILKKLKAQSYFEGDDLDYLLEMTRRHRNGLLRVLEGGDYDG